MGCAASGVPRGALARPMRSHSPPARRMIKPRSGLLGSRRRTFAPVALSHQAATCNSRRAAHYGLMAAGAQVSLNSRLGIFAPPRGGRFFPAGVRFLRGGVGLRAAMRAAMPARGHGGAADGPGAVLVHHLGDGEPLDVFAFDLAQRHVALVDSAYLCSCYRQRCPQWLTGNRYMDRCKHSGWYRNFRIRNNHNSFRHCSRYLYRNCHKCFRMYFSCFC